MFIFSMRFVGAISGVLATLAVTAAVGADYRLDELTFNAGGHPLGGARVESTSYSLQLDSVGETLSAPELRSTSYSMDVGHPRRYPPAREVVGLRLMGDKTTLTWFPERSVGSYRVYGGSLAWLPLNYGVCNAHDLASHQVTIEDLPAPGEGFFYVVTARTTLMEEGPKGYDSTGALRTNPAPCP